MVTGVFTILEKIRRLGCDQVEVFFEETEEQCADAQGVHLPERRAGYAVRFLKSERLGFAASDDPESLFRTALEMVTRLEECPVAPFTFPAVHDKRQTPPHYDSALDRQTFDERVAVLRDFGALDGGRYAERLRHVHLVNSRGLDLTFKGSYFEWEHGDGRILRKRRFRDLVAAYRPPPPEPGSLGRTEWPPEFVLSAPAAAMLLALLSPLLLEGATQRQWSISNPEISLVDDGTIPYGFGTEPVDGEGSAPERTALVQDGEPAGAIADRRLARAFRTRSTGNCVRESYLDKPTCGFTNLILPPGTLPLDEYLAAQPAVLQVTALRALRLDGNNMVAEARGNRVRYGERAEAIVAEFRLPPVLLLDRVIARFDNSAAFSRFTAPSLLVRGRA